MMKRLILPITLLMLVLLQSCSKPKEETKLEKYGITLTSPKLNEAPEYTDLKVSETDTELSRYDFNMGGHARVNVIEITPSVYPADVDMLKKAVSESEDFVEMIDTKKLSNGAFGVIYKEKGSDGKSIIKNYVFYFKKGDRYFRMEPVFNSELKDLDSQVAAWESMK